MLLFLIMMNRRKQRLRRSKQPALTKMKSYPKTYQVQQSLDQKLQKHNILTLPSFSTETSTTREAYSPAGSSTSSFHSSSSLTSLSCRVIMTSSQFLTSDTHRPASLSARPRIATAPSKHPNSKELWTLRTKERLLKLLSQDLLHCRATITGIEVKI